MTWRDKSDFTRTELRLGTVVHSDHYPTGNHVDEVRNLTTLCSDGWLNAFRPTPTRLICDANNLSVAQVNTSTMPLSKCRISSGALKLFLIIDDIGPLLDSLSLTRLLVPMFSMFRIRRPALRDGRFSRLNQKSTHPETNKG
jgi:hypothetical protein